MGVALGDGVILVIVNLDPIHAQESVVHWDMASLGVDSEKFAVTDLIDGATFTWSRETFVRLDPTAAQGKVAHIAQVNFK